MKKILITLFVVLSAVYALLLSNPALYFNKKIEYKDFTVRYRGALAGQVEGSLDSAAERIAASELFKEGERYELFVPATRGQFLFFTPLNGGEYVRVNPFHGAIFLAAANFAGGEARKKPGDAKFRSLSGVISAGVAREQTRRKLRALTYIFMNDWKVRGYAEKVSGGTGEFNPSDACVEPATPEQLDYKYGLMLETVLKEENAFYNDLLDRNFSRQNAETRMKKAHCGG